MSAERYHRIAAAFSERVEAVAPESWDLPAPCEGWRARDVVGHLVEWMPGLFFGKAGIPWAPGPSVEEDPVAAWRTLDVALTAALDSDAVGVELDLPPGRMTFAQAVDMLGTNDILVHTWDLARATGLDERLDAESVAGMLAGIEPMDAALRSSGHYGPRVPVPDDADAQTKLLAFLGRHP